MAGPINPFYGEATVWSALLLDQLQSASIYRQALTNSKYEGEAKKGGTVKMFWLNPPTVKPYTGAWPDSEWEKVSDNEAILQITEAHRITFDIPSINKSMNVYDIMSEATKLAANEQGKAIDDFISSKHVEISANNLLGTDAAPITVGLTTGQTKPSVFLQELRLKLDEAESPIMSPRIVVPSWFAAMMSVEIGLQNIALLGEAASKVANQRDNTQRNEGLVVSNVFGYSEIWASNRVPNTNNAKFKIIAGDPRITFAMGLEESDIVKIQNNFSIGYKALTVYGAKLPRPEYMALGTVNRGEFQ